MIKKGLLFSIAVGTWFILLMNVAGHPAHQRHRQKTSKLPPTLAKCFPPDVKGDEIAVYGINGAKNVSIDEALKELKARCERGRIVRGKPGGIVKEIRFFRRLCEGYPAPNYVEAQAEEKRKLEELRARYTVIVIDCDPRLPRAPAPAITQPIKNPF